MSENLPEHTTSSGNVFFDLGLPNPEERLTKARLAQRISVSIEAQGLTPTEASEKLRLEPSEVETLLCGRLSKVSVGDLMRYLKALDQSIEIVIEDRARSSNPLAREVVPG